MRRLTLSNLTVKQIDREWHPLRTVMRVAAYFVRKAANVQACYVSK
jgi:hypothetical protein